MRNIAVLLACVVTASASADVVTHFGNGRGREVAGLLDRLGIGRSNASAETAATTLDLWRAAAGSSASGGSASGGSASGGSRTLARDAPLAVGLTFTLARDGGAFRSTFGFYDPSRVTAHPAGDPRSYAAEALRDGTVVFDERVDKVGSTRTFELGGARGGAPEELAFFLIPNADIETFRDQPDSFFPSLAQPAVQRTPLFSVSDANPGRHDQMLFFAAKGNALVSFEDLTRDGASDSDFDDLAIAIAANFQPQETSHMPEPAALLLFGAGALGSFALARRRRRD